MNDAEQTKRIVKWYQTILSTACGYVDVPVNGNHNDVLTKPAFRNFQETYGLEPSGYLTVEANFALNQVAMQWIYRRSLSNTIGKFTDVLRDQIKEFQADYGLETDGKVGPKTMEAMVNVLNGTLPLPFPYWRPDLSSEQFLGVEDGKAGQEPDLLQTGAASAEPGVIGTDDREAQTNTIKEPNRWVCLLNVKLECRNLIYGSNPITETRCGSVWSLGGTGLLISPRHILTAAHVLENFLDEQNNNQPTKRYIATRVEVAPGYNGGFGVFGRRSFREPYDSHETERHHYLASYSYFSGKTLVINIFNDFALIELTAPIHLLAPLQTRRFLLNGKWHQEDRTLPPLGFWGTKSGLKPEERELAPFQIKKTTTAQLQGQEIQTIGYPSKTPKVGSRPRWMQWHARGKVNGRGNSANHSLLFFHIADTTNSQSGSPIWTISRVGDQDIHTLVGIVTANTERQDGTILNEAVALTDPVLKQIQQWAPQTFDYDKDQDGRLTVKV